MNHACITCITIITPVRLDLCFCCCSHYYSTARSVPDPSLSRNRISRKLESRNRSRILDDMLLQHRTSPCSGNLIQTQDSLWQHITTQSTKKRHDRSPVAGLLKTTRHDEPVEHAKSDTLMTKQYNKHQPGERTTALKRNSDSTYTGNKWTGGMICHAVNTTWDCQPVTDHQ